MECVSCIYIGVRDARHIYRRANQLWEVGGGGAACCLLLSAFERCSAFELPVAQYFTRSAGGAASAAPPAACSLLISAARAACCSLLCLRALLLATNLATLPSSGELAGSTSLDLLLATLPSSAAARCSAFELPVAQYFPRSCAGPQPLLRRQTTADGDARGHSEEGPVEPTWPARDPNLSMRCGT